MSDSKPINAELFNTSPKSIAPYLKNIVKVPDITHSSTSTFHEDGLYSTSIFGEINSPERYTEVGLIKLNTTVLNPVVFKELIRVKKFYGDIMSGKAFAVWNDEKKDFESSDVTKGKTGYEFFISKFKEIIHVKNDSDSREAAIDLIKKYLDTCLITHWIVIPAGFRDVTITNGRMEDNEINDLYKAVINKSNTIPLGISKQNISSIDNLRYSIQFKLYEIYLYIESLVKGKNKFISSGFSSRKIEYSTSAVITPVTNYITDMDSPNNISPEASVINLYMMAKSLLPLTVFHLKNDVLNNALVGEGKILLFRFDDKIKEYVREPTEVNNEEYSKWSTLKGIEDLVNKLKIDTFRRLPVLINKKPMYYIEVNEEEKYYDLIYDVDYLNTEKKIKNKNIRPINYSELFYISMYKWCNSKHGIITRYPVIKEGSTYPSELYIKTTDKGLVLEERINGKETGEIALEYPDEKSSFFSSMSVNEKNVDRLQADYDGDQCYLNPLLTINANQNAAKVLKSKEYNIDHNGQLTYSSNTSTAKLVLGYLTK